MTTRRKPETNLFFSDGSIGVFERRIKGEITEIHGSVALEKGILEGGYVADPDLFVGKLRTLFKTNRLKPKRIRLVLNSQNVVMRVVAIPRAEIHEEGVAAYLDGQLGKTLHFPFPQPRVSYHIIGQDAELIRVLAVSSDDKLLNDYLDIFDALKVREVVFDMPSLCLYTLFTATTEVRYRSMMLVTVYESYFTIKIFEEDIPIFNLVEEFEGDYEQRYDRIDNYVERVANYYRYNMKDGEKQIESVLLVNLSEQADDAHFAAAFAPKPAGIPYRIFQFPEAMTAGKDGWNRATLIAYAAGIEKAGALEKIHHFDFRLDRPFRMTRMLHRIFALALAIFSAVSIVYIPYHAKTEEIDILANMNENQAAQLAALEAEIALLPTFNARERAYSDAYDALIAREFDVSPLLLDLTAFLGTDIAIVSYEYDAALKELTVKFAGPSVDALEEYLMAVFETHGIVAGSVDPERWIDGFPAYATVGTTLIEVTFHHA